MNPEAINAVIRETLEANNALDLLPMIRWEWNGRLTSTMGLAFVGTGKIQFSPTLFARASEQEAKNTVCHEVAHIIAWQKHQSRGHCVEWAMAMRKSGYNPTRCHKVPVQRRARTMRRVYCNCPDGILITQNLYTRTFNNGEWQDGTNLRRWCRKCRAFLRLKP